jgi:iron complex outermembrane receptor protein
MGSTAARIVVACMLVLASAVARAQDQAAPSESQPKQDDTSLDQLIQPDQSAPAQSQRASQPQQEPQQGPQQESAAPPPPPPSPPPEERKNADAGATPSAASTPAAPPPKSRHSTIEEIVVTAQKREENLQAVPIAVQAFSGDDLVKAGVTDTQALQNITPGLVYNSNAGYAQAYIRGIGTDATLPTADPSVATYVDGVYYPFIQSTIQSFGDVQRVEILKGPQGTLYGRNSTGGAINVVTKDPGQETLLSADAELGNLGRQRLSLFGSMPFTDWAAVSVAGFYDFTDALYHQINPTGPAIVDTRNWGVRAKVRFAFFDALNLTLSGYILDHKGSDTNVANSFKEYAVSSAYGAVPNPTPYVANTDLPERNAVNIQGVNLKVGWEGFSWFDIKSLSAYQDVLNLGFVDFERSPKRVAGFAASPAFAKTFSEELQLVSKDSERFQWVAGGFFLKGKGGYVPLRFFLGTPSSVPVLPGVPDIASLLSSLPLPPLPGLPVETSTYLVIPLAAEIDTRAYAGFGQLTWTVFDWLKLTGGLRYSTETRDFVRNQIYQPFSDPNPPFGYSTLQGDPVSSNPPRSAKFSALTPKFGIDLPFSNLLFADSGMLYVSYSKGFKSGTFNPVRLVDTTPPPPVQPEEVKAYEGGFKTDLLDNTMRLNASYFMYDYTNVQLQFIELTSGGAVRLENAGAAKIKGIEMEFMWVPIDRLAFTLIGSQMLKSVYTECNCTTYDQTTGMASHQDLSGNQMIRTPRTTASAHLTYVFDLLGTDLEAAVSGYYNSGYFFDVQNVMPQAAYTLLDARLSFTPHRAPNFTLSVFVNNIADKTYLINGNVNDFSEFGTFGSPRTFGVRLKWDSM